MRLNNYIWQSVENEEKIRAQVVLTAGLKRLVEAKKRLTGETLSEYLRKAVLWRLLAEDEEEQELTKLARLVVGSVSLKNHPEWRTKKKIGGWLKKLRREWEEPV